MKICGLFCDIQYPISDPEPLMRLFFFVFRGDTIAVFMISIPITECLALIFSGLIDLVSVTRVFDAVSTTMALLHTYPSIEIV